MPQPLSFDHLQEILRQHTAGLPDLRKPSPNTRYTIQNAALGAFGIFFTQSPSFLEYQRQLNQCQGHDNAQTLFGVEPIPCDNQRFTPSFGDVWRGLVSPALLYRGDTHGSAVSASHAGTPPPLLPALQAPHRDRCCDAPLSLAS
jgi:hypothetical protein